PIGALYDTHHGMTNAVFMPYVLAFNRSAIEERINRLTGYLGIEGGFDGFMQAVLDRKSTRLNSSHVKISYAVFCLKKKIMILYFLYHPLLLLFSFLMDFFLVFYVVIKFHLRDVEVIQLLIFVHNLFDYIPSLLTST